MGSAVSLEIFKEFYEMMFGSINEDSNLVQHSLATVTVDPKNTTHETTVRARTVNCGNNLSFEGLNLV